jgi:hypothetical protein
METKIINGHKAIIRHIFKAEELKVGSRWIGAGGGKTVVTIECLNQYGSIDPWTEVVYSWELNGEKFTHEKDVFIFQSKYCLILE